MTRDHARKNAARRQQRNRGGRHTAANAAAAAHDHPRPDADVLRSLPYSGDRSADLRLAAKVIAACRAGCAPCQTTHIPRLLTGDRATVAVIAGAVFGVTPAGFIFAPPAVQRWAPLAQAAHAAHRSGDATAAAHAALDELDHMTSDDVADVLDYALNMWAAGAANITFVTLADDADSPDDADTTNSDDTMAEPRYALAPTVVSTEHGSLPCLILIPETATAGLGHLRSTTGWPTCDIDALPPMDPNWRVRVGITTRALEEIVHVDHYGDDDITLWHAAEAVPLPDTWFDLIDRTQHVLLCGPVDDVSPDTDVWQTLQQAAAAGTLHGIVARARFW
ncbi:hypothetical protein ACQEVF_57810 [Nonomuraea polychroma]|uniref:hypothetical protein n=1 Tax=Nonomuraea polychroma TaxID=46176 RepID=UPI003D93ED70